jgi:DNA polymerase V
MRFSSLTCSPLLDTGQHGEGILMGFVSPDTDYVEQRLTIDSLCVIDGNCRVNETSCGWAVINVTIKVSSGDTLLGTMMVETSL